ncbi:MAG: M20 family metallopeptidase [Chloroflexi bacterium]|nr:MAG: M20 family metallopeptidase [Chloroflexota bacterium]
MRELTRTVPGAWSEMDERLLLDLLEIDTVTPMEGGSGAGLRVAQERLAAGARAIGFDVELFEPPPPSALEPPELPLTVRERAADLGGAFLGLQPNLVLRLGRQPRARTLVFNCHLDTVADHLPVRRRGDIVYGRGAVDAKGQAAGVLAGVRLALEAAPDLGRSISVLIHAVGGEEGGAMGFTGTRVLAERGCVGRLNVVAEPTRLAILDRTTASMTARVEVTGDGSTDDEPAAGHNATIALGGLVHHLTRHLAPRVQALGGKLCIAGLHTGTTHNRVHGSGQLLVNFAYGSAPVAAAIERCVEEELAAGLRALRADLAGVGVARRTAADLPDICRLVWLKRGLPVLDNRDPGLEAVLRRAGIGRHDGSGGLQPFTCDAMWLQCHDSYTVVLGAGDLATNQAHADGEHVAISELAALASAVADLVLAFRGWIEEGGR